jgi:hypothetical protein
MSRIHWLASYPKSGNTWVRVLLSNYFSHLETPVDIHELETEGIACDRDAFDRFAGIAAADLTPGQIDHYRPLVYERMAEEHPWPLFIKIHDAYTIDPQGMPTVTARSTAGVLYLVRNPLDVAVSFSHHLGQPLEAAIARMNDPASCFAGHSRRLSEQLRQRLLTWSGHVSSWLDGSGLPIKLVRYEDLLEHPAATFTGILQALGLAPDPRRVEQAVAFSAFPVLAAQESVHGFRERPRGDQRFFRQGRAGDWRDQLTPDQAGRIVAAHGPMMRRLGYLENLPVSCLPRP